MLAECFGHISAREIRECFYAQGTGRVLAYRDGSIVGQIEVFLRMVEFLNRRILLGGIGGTCVTKSARHRGIGKALVRSGLEVLERKACDVACLNANVREHSRGGLYYGLGFRRMPRKISFENVNGKVRFDSGELFKPVRSQELYDLVMQSQETFHLGRGYW